MKCPKCGSENVNVQIVTDVKQVKKHHSAAYWIFVGWWLQPILWLFLTLPMLIIKICKPKKVVSDNKNMAVCQNCGHSWQV